MANWIFNHENSNPRQLELFFVSLESDGSSIAVSAIKANGDLTSHAALLKFTNLMQKK